MKYIFIFLFVDVASNHSIEKEKQKKIKYEMRKKKREMDNLKKELANSIKRENFGQSKRKRLVEEKDDLEKKLARCENLLKEVPKNDFQLWLSTQGIRTFCGR